jgi:hypothetical protein
MQNSDMLSRRAVVGGLAFAPALSAPTVTAGMKSLDADLVELDRQLHLTIAALDSSSDHDETMLRLREIEDLNAAMVATHAKTLHGLYLKARATAWALISENGPLDPAKELTLNDQISASIVRDLLNLGADASELT